MTEYLDKWDGDIIRALRFQDEEICELAADEITRLRAALSGLLREWEEYYSDGWQGDVPLVVAVTMAGIARAALEDRT